PRPWVRGPAGRLMVVPSSGVMVISSGAAWLSVSWLVAALSVMVRLPNTTPAVTPAIAGASRHSSTSRAGRKRSGFRTRAPWRRLSPPSNCPRKLRMDIRNLLREKKEPLEPKTQGRRPPGPRRPPRGENQTGHPPARQAAVRLDRAAPAARPRRPTRLTGNGKAVALAFLGGTCRLLGGSCGRPEPPRRDANEALEVTGKLTWSSRS